MKLSIKKFTTFAGFAACLALPWSAQGAWTLIQDFEDVTPGTYTAGGVPDLIYPMSQNGGLGMMVVLSEAAEGIAGIGGDRAAWFTYGEVLGSLGDAWHKIPLEPAIEPGQTATIYYRLWMSSYDINHHVMFDKVAPQDELNGTALWGNMAAIIRYNSTEPLDIDAHNGSTYMPSYPTLLPELGTWTEFWVVIDNSFDMSTEPPSQVATGGWKLYRKTPADSEPVLQGWGNDTDNRTAMGLRNKSYTSIKTMVLAQNAQQSPNIWLIDDIWQTSGMNLNTPPEEGSTTWCGYNVVTGDYVDTGSWMEWVYVGAAPGGAPGWIYSVNLNDWVYAAGCPGAGGTWVYIPN